MFFKFRPIYKQLIWGGEKILPFKNVQSDMTGIGESWELSGVADNESVVSGGPYDGLTISRLMALLKTDLMGSRYGTFDGVFPLLIKFIDAARDLSLQVHPDDALAMQRHGCLGKTEMWYVIGAEKGATLCSGFSKPMDKSDYERWIDSPQIMDSVANHPLHAGDVFFLPAGRVHSIGAGAFIAEIQQTSNITYRLYDYGRLGNDGLPRRLHRDEARDAIDYTPVEDYRTHYTPRKNEAVTLVDCDKFTTKLLSLDGPMARDYESLDSFVIYVCTAGKARLKDDENNAVLLSTGETLLVAAKTNRVTIEPDGGVNILEVNI